MSEFELITLFNQFFDQTFSRLTDFLTGTFAMLVSVFFVGARLSRYMARLVVFLYTLFSIATAVPTLAVTLRFVNTATLLRESAADPGSMIHRIFLALPSPYAVMPVMTLILLGAYVGTLAFFLQVRRGKAPSVDAMM